MVGHADMEAGACSSRAKSTHVAYRFRFDAAIGDYTARTKYKVPDHP